MTIGSLFSGVGGLELGLEWAGLGPVLWQVESSKACRQVLRRHWPDAQRVSHVQAVPGSALPIPDIVCGGFPCQDVSQANPGGRGLDGERSGLFWWFLDVLDSLGPTVAVIENVGGLAGRDLDTVGRELVGRGFEVEATRLWAPDVGSPQKRRERFFILAYGDRRRLEVERQPGRGGTHGNLPDGRHGAMADAPRPRRRHRQPEPTWRSLAAERDTMADPRFVRREGVQHGDATPEPAHGGDGAQRERATESGLGRDADGLSARLERARWPAPRFAPRHPDEPPILKPRSPGDRARLRALGNAVMPHMAYVVGLRIRQVTGW